MLWGAFKHVVDSKNRIFVPAGFRDDLGESFIVTRSFRGNFLCFYSRKSWDEYIAPLKAAPRKTSEDTLRFLYRTAAEVTPDAQGRILLPQTLIAYAGIEKVAYVVGVGEYGEIWSEKEYLLKTENENIEKMREELELLGL